MATGFLEGHLPNASSGPIGPNVGISEACTSKQDVELRMQSH